MSCIPTPKGRRSCCKGMTTHSAVQQKMYSLQALPDRVMNCTGDMGPSVPVIGSKVCWCKFCTDSPRSSAASAGLCVCPLPAIWSGGNAWGLLKSCVPFILSSISWWELLCWSINHVPCSPLWGRWGSLWHAISSSKHGYNAYIK
jgi:hypothetical protein